MIGSDSLSPAPACRSSRPLLVVQNLSRTMAGNPYVATATRGSASICTQTAPADADQSDLLGRAPAGLEQLAIHFDDRPAGDCGWLASERLSSVLDLENSSWPTGSA